MKNLEYFLRPTQNELFKMLRKMFRGKLMVKKGAYLLVPGEAPIMLLAHLDTVHTNPVSDICLSNDGNILMSPQGIGGDDRCGVYALACAYEMSKVKPWLLFTCDEETGGVGAERFAKDYEMRKMPKALRDVKCLVEVDRKGSKDAVYYSCGNTDFEEYITTKGFVTDFGSYSDISEVAPAMGVAAVNLSSGYYNAHTLHEYINRSQLEAVIKKVVEIIDDACQPGFPKYEYVERVSYGRRYGYTDWDDWFARFERDRYSTGTKAVTVSPKVTYLEEDDVEDLVPNDLPVEYVYFYENLLDMYTYSELEELRKMYGDRVIQQLFEDECGPMYDMTGYDLEDDYT